MADKALIGQRVRQQRERLGLSLSELAHQAGGKDKGTVWRIEKGKAMPKTDLVIKFAEIFQVSTDYLLGLVDSPEKRLTSSDLPPDQLDLIAHYLGASEAMRNAILELLMAGSGFQRVRDSDDSPGSDSG